jgi:signal peptidase I
MQDDALAAEEAGINEAGRARLNAARIGTDPAGAKRRRGGGSGQPGPGQPDSGTPDPEQPGSEQPGSGQPEPEPEQSRMSFMTEMVVLFVVALTIALLIKTFVVQPFFIPSASMEDTIRTGDKVLVNKLVYHLRPIQRGDIVVFNGEGSWDPPVPPAPSSSDPLVRFYDVTVGALIRSVKDLFGTPLGQTDYIKRVIGLPGDHVACCNAHGQITVNGVALAEKSFLAPGAQPSQYHFSVVVPAGRLWVMGDNRIISADSRLHDCAYPDHETCVPYDRDGTIPVDKVVGRAFVIVWPLSRFRVLPIPSTFSQSGLHPAAAGSHAPAGASAARAGQAIATLAGSGAPVRPSPPYLPLAAGLVAGVPLTLLERRVRLRQRRRRSRAR